MRNSVLACVLLAAAVAMARSPLNLGATGTELFMKVLRERKFSEQGRALLEQQLLQNMEMVSQWDKQKKSVGEIVQTQRWKKFVEDLEAKLEGDEIEEQHVRREMGRDGRVRSNDAPISKGKQGHEQVCGESSYKTILCQTCYGGSLAADGSCSHMGHPLSSRNLLNFRQFWTGKCGQDWCREYNNEGVRNGPVSEDGWLTKDAPISEGFKSRLKFKLTNDAPISKGFKSRLKFKLMNDAPISKGKQGDEQVCGDSSYKTILCQTCYGGSLAADGSCSRDLLNFRQFWTGKCGEDWCREYNNEGVRINPVSEDGWHRLAKMDSVPEDNESSETIEASETSEDSETSEWWNWKALGLM